VAKADVTSGPLPLTVNFDGTGSSDPDNDSLTYSWNFGDGTTGTGAIVQHVYNRAGKYNAVLTVADRPSGGLTNTAAAIVITAGNNAPVPTINTPLTTDKYVAGQTIKFSGNATDVEDGTLPASAFHWSFLFGHNTHFHDFIGPINGVTSSSFVVPLTGETDPDQYYRIFLTVTDSNGLSTTTYRDIRPVLSTFTLASNISGAQLLLDSQPKAAGTTTTGVVGMKRTIEAPAMQLINGRMYKFVSWSDGGAAKHTISTPNSATTYTAKYQAMPLAATYASNAPSQLLAGQTVKYQVTVTNVGTQTWSPTGTNRVRLGVYFGNSNDAAGAWGTAEPLRFALTKSVAPGQSATFNVQVTAPTKAGTYILRDRMVKEYVAWFDTMEKINATVGTLHASYAGTPPTIWGTGLPQHDLVVVTNTGTLTWRATGPDRVRMGIYFGTSDTPPTAANAIQYYSLPFDVPPGQSAPVLIDVFGPANAGHMTIYHRLIQDRGGWFSDMYRTPAWVQVLSAQYNVAPPTQWVTGEFQTYNITLTNNGSDTWDSTGPNAVHLGVYFGGASDDIGAWTDEPMRFSLPYDLAPGQSVTLTVSVQAPAGAGSYVLRQRMVKEFVNWFVPLAKTDVTVS
jgi:chitodextrinase